MVSAGHKFRADDIPGDPIPFTPAWTASTTSPTNYTSSGYYFTAGKLILAHAKFTPNAGFTAGSGLYYFALPFSVAAALGLEDAIGNGILRDSGTARYGISIMPSSSGNNRAFALYDDGSGKSAPVAHNTPITMVNGDAFSYDVKFWVD